MSLLAPTRERLGDRGGVTRACLSHKARVWVVLAFCGVCGARSSEPAATRSRDGREVRWGAVEGERVGDDAYRL